MQDFFDFDQPGMRHGRVIGTLKSIGLRPKFADKYAMNDIELPAGIFPAEAQEY